MQDKVRLPRYTLERDGYILAAIHAVPLIVMLLLAIWLAFRD